MAAVLPDDGGASATRAVDVQPRDSKDATTSSALMTTPVSRFQRHWQDLQDRVRSHAMPKQHLMCLLLGPCKSETHLHLLCLGRPCPSCLWATAWQHQAQTHSNKLARSGVWGHAGDKADSRLCHVAGDAPHLPACELPAQQPGLQ